MKRIVPRSLVVAASAAAGICWRAPIVAALGFGTEDGRYLGYVEGETSLIAPPIAGRLVERPVDRGGQVKKGDRLFVIDPVMAKAEVARTEAALAEAGAARESAHRQAAGRVGRHRRAAPQSEAALEGPAEVEMKRQADLLTRGVTTRQNYDQAESMTRQLHSRAASLAAQERSASSRRGPMRSLPPRRRSTRTGPTSRSRASGSTT